MAGELENYRALNSSLVSMVDAFESLIRAASIRSEDDAQRKQDDAPGELYEVLAENLVLQAQHTLHHVAELKRNVFLRNFDLLLENIKETNAVLYQPTERADYALHTLRGSAAELLGELEAHYYASPYVSAIPPKDGDAGAECGIRGLFNSLQLAEPTVETQRVDATAKEPKAEAKAKAEPQAEPKGDVKAEPKADAKRADPKQEKA